MALSGWLSKCPITVQGSRVPASATGLPVLVVASNLPAALMDTSGGCATDGRDIRFTSDVDGVTELPREIVSIDKTLGTAAIYVKIPTLTASTNLTLYVHWNNTSADEPGKGSASESKLVWSDYYGAFHFQNVVNGWKGVIDSSGSWSNMTPIGTPLIVTGHASGTKAAKLSATFGLTLHEFMSFSGLTNDLMFWCNLNGTQTVGNIATGTNGIPLGWLAAGQFGAGWGLFATTSNAVPASGWHHVWVRNAAGTAVIYVDGVNKTQGGGTAQAVNFTTFGLGSGTAAWSVSEIRMTRGTNIPVNNGLVMYSNESNPSAFITPGVPVVQAAGYTLTITGINDGTEVRIFLSADQTELAGVESSVGNFVWNFEYTGDFTVYIVLLHKQYEYIRYDDFVISSGNITVPVNQRYDRNYSNPA